MSMRTKPENIVEAALDLADVVLDFIEQELGANSYEQNWTRLKSQGATRDVITKWASDVGISVKPEDIERAVQSYVDKGAKWLTPYTSPIPPEDWRVRQVS